MFHPLNVVTGLLLTVLVMGHKCQGKAGPDALTFSQSSYSHPHTIATESIIASYVFVLLTV